jgi:hypothetical protein
VLEHRTSANLIAYKGDDMAATQNTPVVIGDTLSVSIKSAHVRKLMQTSQATGYSLSEILNRAVQNWLAIEAPVYLAHAKEAKAKAKAQRV